ncbi:MAG: hypothetical protein IJK26_05870 [Clostridia bacterium]|nr:hypothetical protein [Clostridia bacterium]
MRRIKTFITIMIGVSGLLLMLWFIMPSVNVALTYVPVAIASAIFTFLTFVTDRKHILNYILIFLPCLFIALLYFIVPYSFSLKPAVNIFQQMVIFTAPVMLATYLINLDDRNTKYNRFYKLSLLAVAVCILTVYLITMKELSVHPNICRALAAGVYNEKYEELIIYRRQNVGGFGFSYAMGIIEIASFYSAVRYKGKKRIIYALVTLALLVFIVRAQFMTLLILCVTINFLTSLRFAKSYATKAFIVFAIVLLLVFSGPITGALAGLITGERLSERMYALSGFLEGDGYNSWRLEFIKDCLESISKHLFFGQPDMLNNYEARSISANSHSTQFKLLVDIGLAGSVIYNYYLFYLRKYMVKLICRNGGNPEPFIICFWFLWILSWLNPVFQNYELPFALFLVIPLFICLNGRGKGAEKGRNGERKNIKSSTVEL